MRLISSITVCCLAFLLPKSFGYSDLDSIADSLLQELSLHRDDSPLGGFPLDDYSDIPREPQHPDKDYSSSFNLRRDAFLAPEPVIRDQEYLEHSSLFGSHSMQGGAGEGHQRLRPDGSIPNVEVIKSDSIIPAYCNPANPCPLGYTANDGCLEEKFSNTPEFSREYQAAQNCMCDSEHMFDCPSSTRDSEINALARSLENEEIADNTLDRIIHNMQPANPLLDGEKLPVVAKKTPRLSGN